MKNYGSYNPPRRVQIMRGSGAGYFKAGSFGYAIGYDDRGGYYWVDREGSSSPGERAYLVSKAKHGRGGALWFSEGGVRFTARTKR